MTLLAVIYGRNEENNLPETLRAIHHQTVPPDKTFYIDDASTDGSVEIARQHGAVAVQLTKRHPNYLATGQVPMMAEIGNACLKAVYDDDPDYFMVVGADTRLASDYTGKLLYRMNKRKLVISGGRIKGETFNPRIGRGSGRIYDFNFWKQHVGWHPYAYSWETYPLLVAEALGFKTKFFPDILAHVERPTRRYSAYDGYTSRERGYSIVYLLIWCLKGALLNQDFRRFKQILNFLQCKTLWRDQRVVQHSRRVESKYYSSIVWKVINIVRKNRARI